VRAARLRQDLRRQRRLPRRLRVPPGRHLREHAAVGRSERDGALLRPQALTHNRSRLPPTTRPCARDHYPSSSSSSSSSSSPSSLSPLPPPPPQQSRSTAPSTSTPPRPRS